MRAIVLLRRCQSSVAGAGGTAAKAAAAAAPSAVVAAAPADALVRRVPTTDEAASKGDSVTPSWARYNLSTGSTFALVEASKAPVLSGVDDAVPPARKAIIYRVSQSSMTSGTAASGHWALRWAYDDKWANPLMGWLSSADTLAPTSMHLRFETPEAAITLCERNGWAYEVSPASTNSAAAGKVDNQYAYNFLPRDVQARMKAAGPRKATAIFRNPAAGTATWVNYRRTQFGTEPWKPASYQTAEAWTGEPWPAPAPHAKDGHGGGH